MAQIKITANCAEDENGWWHPDGTGCIYTDRDGDGYPCDTPLEPQKMGQHWVLRCKGKLSWVLDWSYLWEDEIDGIWEDEAEEIKGPSTVQCPACKCVYNIIPSG